MARANEIPVVSRRVMPSPDPYGRSHKTKKRHALPVSYFTHWPISTKINSASDSLLTVVLCSQSLVGQTKYIFFPPARVGEVWGRTLNDVHSIIGQAETARVRLITVIFLYGVLASSSADLETCIPLKLR
jgi:hypothetical protein